MASAMAANEFFNEIDSSTSRKKSKQECFEAIGESSQNMFKVLSDRLGLNNAPSISENLINGITQMPLYCVRLILEKQKNDMSIEQSQALNLYFDNFSYPYTISDFSKSIKYENQVAKECYELLAIDNDCAGLFWKDFFREIQNRGDCYEIIDEFIQEFSNCAINFSLLGNNSNDLAIGILTNLINSIYDQFVIFEDKLEKNIEIVADANYFDHLNNMDSEIHIIEALSNCQEEGLDLLELYEYFCMGIFYLVINEGICAQAEKYDIFDQTVSFCNKEFGFNGKEIFDSFKYAEGLGPLILNMVSTEFDNNFWVLLATVINKCTLLCGYESGMIKECIDFVIGLDQTLCIEYPNSGYGNFARKYAQNCLEQILEVCN